MNWSQAVEIVARSLLQSFIGDQNAAFERYAGIIDVGTFDDIWERMERIVAEPTADQVRAAIAVLRGEQP